MWFNVVLENHGGPAAILQVTPIVNYIRNMLALCGHDVTVVNNQLHPKAINLYLEHFFGGAYAEKFRQMRRSRGMKIGVIATELMVRVAGKRVIPYAKYGIHYAQDAQSHEKVIAQRIEGFDAVLPEVDFVWALLERTANDCRDVAKICEFMPVGCVELVNAQLRRCPKDLDVVFFGRSTPHRVRVLQSMVQRGIRTIAVGDGFQDSWVPPCILESLLDRAKIGLNLTLHGVEDDPSSVDPRFVSCLRVVEMLSRELLVVSEEIPLDNPYSECIDGVAIDQLPDRCRQLLDSNAWANEGTRRAAHFRSTMDVRTVCAPVIARTLAALS